MLTGWLKVGGVWYYLESSGAMHTGWLQLSDGKYYLKPSGAMQTGWAYLDGKYYYFGYSGLMTEERTTPKKLLTFPDGFYCSPLLADAANTPEERIEAMISTAYTYLGTTYRACTAGAPGTSADCSGLVMQCMYAAGYDPAPISPMRHALPAYEYESRNMWKLPLRHVPLSERKRGDLIFYDNGYGTIIHVAIYLGNDQVIEAWPPKTVIWLSICPF